MGLGAGHTPRVFLLPCSLGDPALAEEPVAGLGGSLIPYDRHASWGAP